MPTTKFDTLVTIIVRGGLKGITPTQVLGDVVTQDIYHEERVDKKYEKKKSVAFKATSSKGKSKKVESSDDDAMTS